MIVDVYEGALKRILWISIALGAAGVIVTLLVWGPDAAAGFFAGALLSLVNLRWWKTVAGAVGDGASSGSPRASVVFLTLRYLLFAAVIYGIVKILKISPAAPLAGLLVSAAAGMIEALYELIYART
jgi:hypothetical protein